MLKNYSLEGCDLVVFDCDGVLLDSNRIKTEAFYQVGLGYGEEAARQLVAHHVANGGISRYEKLRYLFQKVLQREAGEDEYRRALLHYGELVRKGLKDCREIPGVRNLLDDLRRARPELPLYVLSGADQTELRDILRERSMDRYFRGIFGSPASKSDLVRQILGNHAGRKKGLYFGDSRTDFEVATTFGMTFIMIYGHTEWKDWESCLGMGVSRYRDFMELP